MDLRLFWVPHTTRNAVSHATLFVASQHYRELVTEKGAKAWFALVPATAKAVRERIEKERAAKIVAFPVKAAA